MVFVRLWTQGDLHYVADSVRREGWHHLKADVERCWRFKSDGCFIAEADGKPVGHVFSVSYGGAGWIGLLIVNPESRGKGVGALLMHTAIGYLQEKGVETIRLEAVEKAVPLYKRLGFRAEFASLRFVGRRKFGLGNVKSLVKHGETKVFETEESDLEQIVAFDKEYFGADRLRVLRSLYENGLEGGCLAAKEGEEILGYLMSRKVRDALWLGPWVSADSDSAEALFRACVGSVGQRVEGEMELRVGTPVLNKAGVALMGKLGFTVVGSSLRMVWGKRKYRGVVSSVYGIGGAEKG